MGENVESDLSQNRLPDLPIQENGWDEDHPNYWTTVVWERMEHFIHAPRDHDLRDLSREELKKVNWPAIKVAWQRHLKRLYEVEAQYQEGKYVSRIGWNNTVEESGGNHVHHDWGTPEEPEEYERIRAENINAVKEDYQYIRNQLVDKLGEHNNDFGLPENLFD